MRVPVRLHCYVRKRYSKNPIIHINSETIDTNNIPCPLTILAGAGPLLGIPLPIGAARVRGSH